MRHALRIGIARQRRIAGLCRGGRSEEGERSEQAIDAVIAKRLDAKPRFPKPNFLGAHGRAAARRRDGGCRSLWLVAALRNMAGAR
jgi:hypothetical protein